MGYEFKSLPSLWLCHQQVAREKDDGLNVRRRSVQLILLRIIAKCLVDTMVRLSLRCISFQFQMVPTNQPTNQSINQTTNRIRTPFTPQQESQRPTRAGQSTLSDSLAEILIDECFGLFVDVSNETHPVDPTPADFQVRPTTHSNT
jgi:hypothetical protein